MPIYSAEEYYEKHGGNFETHPLPKDCATSNYPRLIHDEETWRLLQDAFYEQTQAKSSYHHKIHARHRHLWYSGLEDDLVEARDVGGENGRGRSIYATADIPSGTKVWYGAATVVHVNNGYWTSPRDVKAFLERLPHNLQCDVLLWAYATVLEHEGYVECNLDEASFFNHGERPELVNVVNKGPDSLASRDISKGEELLMDYTSFIALGDDSLPWWDDIRNKAWREGDGDRGEDEDKTEISSEKNSDDDDKSKNSSVTQKEGVDCMDEYVKYGKPKNSSSTIEASTSTVFADASLLLPNSAPMVPNNTTTCVTTLASFFLALVMARGFATMGMRHR